MLQRDLVFDVGMHHGEDTKYYLARGFRVVAFEADPKLAAACRSIFRKEINSGKLEIVNGAIVENARAGDSIKFYRNVTKSDWGTVSPDWAGRNEHLGTTSEVVNVPVVNFADHLDRCGIPFYMKVDIEGMDTVCLNALGKFEDRPYFVSMESDKTDFDSLCDEIRLLHDLGYTAFQAVQQSTIHKHPVSIVGNGEPIEFWFDKGSSGPFGADLSGEWKTEAQIVDQYKKIFSKYRILGDDGIITRIPGGKTARRALGKLLGRAIPGWYDTHARHCSFPCQ